VIPYGEGYELAWKSGVFPVTNEVSLYIPTPVVSAVGSSEFSSNFPAAAVKDGDRTHLNAGPFDRVEQGYGPADNLIGKGLWMGKHVSHNPVFIFDSYEAWQGNAWYSSIYHQELANITDPVGAYPSPELLAYWRHDDHHKDTAPTASAGGTWDVMLERTARANHGVWEMGTWIFFETTSNWANHHLGYGGLLKGEDTASASLFRGNWKVKPFLDLAQPNKGTCFIHPDYNLGRFTFNFWIQVAVTPVGDAELLAIAKPGRTFFYIEIGPTYVRFPSANSAVPTQGGLGKVFNLHDGLPHMITITRGKQVGGYWAGEIYVDGDLVAYNVLASGGGSIDADALLWIGQNPRGVYYNLNGQMQDTTWHNWPWYGAEQPDYAPGRVVYNQVKYMYEQGANGIFHPALGVAPVFNGTIVVGDKLEADFAGGSSYSAGFDEAYDPQQYQLFDTAWTKIPFGDWFSYPRFDTSQFMIAQDDVLPPDSTGKSVKLFCKPAPWVQGYALNSPQGPGNNYMFAANWQRVLPTPVVSGKVTFETMVHQQGVNPGKGHLMVEFWEGALPATGNGFKVILSEATHNFHISLNADPTLDHNYFTHIYAGDGVNSGVPWAYDTWYTISVEFNVTAGLVKLSVDGTVIAQIAGLSLTTGIQYTRIWHKADDRLPPEFFLPNWAAWILQVDFYGTVVYYLDDLRIGSGCFADPATYEAVLELGGFPIGLADFSFLAESVTISDPPFTYTPYWSFSLQYGDSPTGPWSPLDPIFPNPGKVSSATGVVFDPLGSPYIKVIAQHNADGGACLGSAGLINMELKFGTLATGLTLGTNGEPFGRIIIYTDPDKGGVGSFKLQVNDTSGGTYADIVGSDIHRVVAYQKGAGTGTAVQWDATGEIDVWSLVPLEYPSVIVVDLKRNFDNSTNPVTNFVRVLITDAGTADDLPRCTEVELYARYDVTPWTSSYDVTHAADVTFERIDARMAQLEFRNPRKLDGTFLFNKAMFQKAPTGQTSLDGTAEVVIRQKIEGEWKQLAWLSVDDPGISHDETKLNLQCRGRHEKLLSDRQPAAWKGGSYQTIVAYEMSLCNVPEGFYMLRWNATNLPTFAPIRTGWDEISDLKVAMLDEGIYFDGDGVLRDSAPLVPTVLDTITREGFAQRFVEHVARELAGQPSAIHAVEVDVVAQITALSQLLFTELASTAGAAERTISLAQPADPNSLYNQLSPLQITRAHPLFPKIANTAAGGVITGNILQTTRTKELTVDPAIITDDPNQIVKQSVSNDYVFTKALAIAIAEAKIAKMKKGLNWAEAEWPTSPHVELGDIYRVQFDRRGINQVYIVKTLTHSCRVDASSATFRSSIEFVEQDI